MEIPKPTDADKESFRSLIPEGAGIEVKPMFGNLGAFVHGNMFAGLFGQAIGVRLSESDRAELTVIPGSGPFGPVERPMGGYLSLPASWRDTPEVAIGWIERAHNYVATLPPKIKKKKSSLEGRNGSRC